MARKSAALSLSFLLLVLFSFAGCDPGESIEIKDGTTCAVAGKLSAGLNCAHLRSDATFELDFNHAIEFLEARPERPDPDHPGQTLPAKGAAICLPSADYATVATELELACRLLGKQCTYETQKLIAGIKARMPTGETRMGDIGIAPEDKK